MVKKLPGAEKKVEKKIQKKNLKDWTKWKRKWVVEVVSSQVVLLDTVYRLGGQLWLFLLPFLTCYS